MQSDRHGRYAAAVGKGPPDNAHTSRFLYVRRHLTPRTWKGCGLGKSLSRSRSSASRWCRRVGSRMPRCRPMPRRGRRGGALASRQIGLLPPSLWPAGRRLTKNSQAEVRPAGSRHALIDLEHREVDVLGNRLHAGFVEDADDQYGDERRCTPGRFAVAWRCSTSTCRRAPRALPTRGPSCWAFWRACARNQVGAPGLIGQLVNRIGAGQG
jgi:hypothetical protein